MLVLIWVQTVCKSYQQTTLVDNELIKSSWVFSFLTLCMLGSFSYFLVACCLFFKINFFKKFFQEHRVSNGLNLDQDRHFVGRDLGPNCLQRLSADVKIAASKERVKKCHLAELRFKMFQRCLTQLNL